MQEFLREQRALCSSDLMSLLILPVQRVPRYQLLFAELLRLTPPTHPERPSVEAALSKVQSIAAQINEAKRRAEQMTSVLRVQNRLSVSSSYGLVLFEPHRKLIRTSISLCARERRE